MAKKETGKTSAGGRRGEAGKGTSRRKGASRGEAEMENAPAGEESRPKTRKRSTAEAQESQEAGGTATATMTLDHDQIAERAREIWEQRGRPYGQDEQNWREAERQLREESGTD